MRVKVGQPAPGDDRFAPGAFDGNIGKRITVRVVVGAHSYPTTGTLVEARVTQGGRLAELTVEIDEATPAPDPAPPARCEGLGGGAVSDELLAQMGDAPRALMVEYNANRHRFTQDNFMRIGESLMQMLVCTSMTDVEVAAHLQGLPSGTSGGWRVADAPAGPCPTRPTTHRHLLINVN